MITTSLDVGGVEKMILLLAKELKNRSYKIIVASSGGALVNELRRLGIRHYCLPLDQNKKSIFSFIRSLVAIWKIIISEKIDIIHTHHRWATFVSCIPARILRVPLVTTDHSLLAGKKYFTVWGDRVIAVSNTSKGHLIDYFKVDSNKITVVHNCITFDESNPEKANETLVQAKAMGIGRNFPIILNIGRMVKDKGQEYFILAAKEVLATKPDTQFIIIGDGLEREKLEKLVKDFPMRKKFFFLGEQKDISGFLSIMDFLVVPSLREGFGLVALEAFYFGKPVIASNIGGLSEIVKDQYNGLLVQSASVEDLRQAILLLLGDFSLRLRMGENAKKYLTDNFKVKNTVDGVEKVYLDLCAKNNFCACH